MIMRLTSWQWAVIATPPLIVVIGLAAIAGIQLQTWGLTWIWGLVALWLAGWRWAIGRVTKPSTVSLEENLTELRSQLTQTLATTAQTVPAEKVEAVLRETLEAARDDTPLWQDWPTFFARCQQLVRDVAYLYHPEEKYPLLNIYVPQAYGLIRGTVDDMDRWMQQAAPVLNQMTVAQMYQAYEKYKSLEQPLKRVLNAVELAQWLWNPIAAVAKRVSRPWTNQANQQILINFSSTLRELALTTLCRRAIALYGGDAALLPDPTARTPTAPTPASPQSAQTQTLQSLIEQAQPVEEVATAAVNLLLVGRTGAGKSSLINTLFDRDQAAVDVLPSTDRLASYRWETGDKHQLLLWDSPGYEQVNQPKLRDQVLTQAQTADMIVLVTPALDPALEADLAFLAEVKTQAAGLPTIAVVTQVDRLRPLREWQPPYNWRTGDRPKERNIRDAVQYRVDQLGDRVQTVLPIVTRASDRLAWGDDVLAVELVNTIDPAKAERLARFLRSRDAKVAAAVRLIDRYTATMITGQGVVAIAKTPLFALLAARLTGATDLGMLLAQTIPAEQVPIVASKLLLTYELAGVLDRQVYLLNPANFLTLWPLLLEHNDLPPTQNAWAWGQALVEHWTRSPGDVTQLRQRFEAYLGRAA